MSFWKAARSSQSLSTATVVSFQDLLVRNICNSRTMHGCIYHVDIYIYVCVYTCVWLDHNRIRQSGRIWKLIEIAANIGALIQILLVFSLFRFWKVFQHVLLELPTVCIKPHQIFGTRHPERRWCRLLYHHSQE